MIVITSPTTIPNEINTIHALIENGLELLHIRKPDFSEMEMKQFLSEIKEEYRSQLVLNSQHQLATDFGINRLHFTEKNRKEIAPENLEAYKEKGYHLSTATHCITEFNDLNPVFEYAFLSPVFPSISKVGYQSKVDLLEAVKERSNFSTKLIAMGGIYSENILKTIEAGFDDVALLGGIWNSENVLLNFKSCQQIVPSF